jgi:hypothetical protein
MMKKQQQAKLLFRLTEIENAALSQRGVFFVLPGMTKSPIGYFAFESGPTNCPPKIVTQRWNLGWPHRFWSNYEPNL